MATVMDNVEDVLRRRAAAGVERLVEMGPEAVMEALATPNEVEFFGYIMNELASHAAPDMEDMAKQQAAAARFRARIAEEAGGFMTAADAAQLANSSVQAIYKATIERRLISIEDCNRKLFPRFQFEDKVREPVIELLRATPSSSGWEIMQFIFGRPEGLEGKRPIDLLRRGKPDEVAAVLRFGRALED